MLRRVVPALACLVTLSVSAAARVGGAPPASDDVARHVVLIVGSRGNSCTGVAVARDLVLTVAHCVLAGADYKLVDYDATHRPMLRDVAAIVRHPHFDLNAMLAHRATADLALIKLAEPLPPGIVPAVLGARVPTMAGESFVVAGFGVTVRGDGRTGGTVRAAKLVATGRPGSLQLRLVDAVTRNERPGLGACTGDSGAPVFEQTGGRLMVVGVVSWSTGANNSAGCGGLTGVTPLARYRDWIADTARQLGSPLPP
ncbi:MAG: S1 family peptidase [Xanthobacteraceae bacterium]